MKKRILALLLTGVMTLGLAACSATPAPPAGTPAPPAGTPAAPAGTPAAPAGTPAPAAVGPARTPIAKENLKIGFVHIGDRNDQGYTYNQVLGAEEMMATLGITEDQVLVKNNCPETSTCETYLNELVEAGCNIIFATSFGFEDYVKIVATENPDVIFCHATGTQAASSGLPNMYNYFANIYEGRYLAGIAAGLQTKTNKLGYVAAFPFAEPISGFTAFYLGAKSVNPAVTMDVMYAGTWNDAPLEAQLAQALIDGGADVISQHSDTTTPATTAEKNGVWSVGYNSDQITAAPKASLISTRIDWGVYLTEAVQHMIDGTPIPYDWSKGISENAVQLTPLNTEIAAAGTQEAINAAEVALKAGTLHVFAGPLTGAGMNFDGTQVTLDLKDGEWFRESETVSAPSFNFIIPGITVLG